MLVAPKKQLNKDASTTKKHHLPQALRSGNIVKIIIITVAKIHQMKYTQF